MRAIKFRAWNINEKIMCFDNEDNDKSYWDGVYSSTLRLINFNLNPKYSKYHFMQFIGILDKNNNEIYEGDIVKISSNGEIPDINEGETFAVSFRYGAFRLTPSNNHSRGVCLEDGSAFEVIGNIHETPQLLKEKI